MSTVSQWVAASAILDGRLPEVAHRGEKSMSIQDEVPWPSMEQSFERPLPHIDGSSELNGRWGQPEISDAEKVTRR